MHVLGDQVKSIIHGNYMHVLGDQATIISVFLGDQVTNVSKRMRRVIKGWCKL